MSQDADRPNRILIVETNEDGTEGGSHRALRDLVRHLDHRVFQPVVLLYQHGPSEAPLRAAGVEVHVWHAERAAERAFAGPLPLRRRLEGLARSVARRVRFLRTHGIRLVHVNNSPGRAFDDWLPAARLSRMPCTSHLRAPFAAVRSGAGAWLQRRFDAVIAVSDWVAETAVASGVAPRRVHRVYDGVDVAALERGATRPPLDLRRELGLAAEDFVVLLPGHLKPWKGQRIAIQAALRVAPELRPRLRILMAGATPRDGAHYVRQMEEEIKAGSLGACVRLVGPRNDLFDLMRMADVVLHTSTRPEPFGLVVLEAMALGRPVVASDLGGPREILTERSGILFDPERPQTLAFLLNELARHPDLRDLLGKRARERARDFDLRRTVEGVTRCWSRRLGHGIAGGSDPPHS